MCEFKIVGYSHLCCETDADLNKLVPCPTLTNTQPSPLPEPLSGNDKLYQSIPLQTPSAEHKHNQIAALMRDTSLTPQERQQRIQDIRAGKITQESQCFSIGSGQEDRDSRVASPHSSAATPAHSSQGGQSEGRRERTVFQPDSYGPEAGTRLVLPSVCFGRLRALVGLIKVGGRQ